MIGVYFLPAGQGADMLYGSTLFDYGTHQSHSRAKLHRILVGMSLCTQSCFFRKFSLAAQGGFDMGLKILGDYDVTLRGFLSGWRMKPIGVLIAVFKIGGASAQQADVARQELQQIWTRAYQSPGNPPII